MNDHMSLGLFRQKAAIAALGGLLANSVSFGTAPELAEQAVGYADALVEAMTIDEDEVLDGKGEK